MSSKTLLFCLSVFIAQWSFAMQTINIKIEAQNKNGDFIQESVTLSANLTANEAKEKAFKKANIEIDEDEYENYNIRIPRGRKLDPEEKMTKLTDCSFLILDQ